MKTKIFKYAHTIAKSWNSYKMRVKFQNFELTYADLFAEALKLAYKKFSEKQATKTTQIRFVEVISETPKAVFLSISLNNRTEKKQWVPKSIINLDTFEIQNWFLIKNNIHLRKS